MSVIDAHWFNVIGNFPKISKSGLIFAPMGTFVVPLVFGGLTVFTVTTEGNWFIFPTLIFSIAYFWGAICFYIVGLPLLLASDFKNRFSVFNFIFLYVLGAGLLMQLLLFLGYSLDMIDYHGELDFYDGFTIALQTAQVYSQKEFYVLGLLNIIFSFSLSASIYWFFHKRKTRKEGLNKTK